MDDKDIKGKDRDRKRQTRRTKRSLEEMQKRREMGDKRTRMTHFHGITDALCPQLSTGPIVPPVLSTANCPNSSEQLKLKLKSKIV